MERLVSRIKRMKDAAESGDLGGVLAETDRVVATVNSLLLESLRSGDDDAPIPLGAVQPPPMPTASTYHKRRDLSERFVMTPAYCNACKQTHEFVHWLAARNAVTFKCKFAGDHPINARQARCLSAILRSQNLGGKLDFARLGDMVREAVDAGLGNEDVKLVRRDINRPWSVENAVLVHN